MPGMPVTTLTLETIDRFRSWCIGRGRSENTVKAYSSDLKEFLKAAGQDETITCEEYEELAMSWLNLNRMKVSPSTTARRLTSVRSFAKWAGWGKILEDYIAPTPGKPIPHPLPEGLDGVRRMIECAKNHEQAALATLGGFLGLRISESLSVMTTSFDLDEMMLTVRGKGDKTRSIPVSDEAWNYLVPAYALAMNKPDRRLISYKDRFARQIITNLGLRAGLQRKVVSHDLRATFGTAVLDKTNNIRVAQELLGHASVETTQIYTGVGVAQMREAVQF